MYLIIFLALIGTAASAPNDAICSARPFQGGALQPPQWVLSDHFPWASHDDPQIDAAMAAIAQRAHDFRIRYDGKLETDLLQALVEYETIQHDLSQIDAYLQLSFAVNSGADGLFQRVSKIATQRAAITSSDLEFLTLQLAALPSSSLLEQQARTYPAQYLISPKNTSGYVSLADYATFIDEQQRAFPHTLPLIVESALTARSAWTGPYVVTSTFHKLLADSKFVFEDPISGEKNNLTLSFVQAHLESEFREVRFRALKALNEGLRNLRLDEFSALSLNVVTGSNLIEFKERNFKGVRDSRNLANNLDGDTVDNLLSSVRRLGIDLGKRYYALKRKVLNVDGEDRFTWADRNAPIRLESPVEDVTWEDGVAIVDCAMRSFSPELADFFGVLIAENRIDAMPKLGKSAGAFCAPCNQMLGPFQMVNFIARVKDTNYLGKKSDVLTLAHEVGHAVHSMLSYDQGYLQFQASIAFSEIASLFNEYLVFRHLVNTSNSEEEKLTLIMAKLDSFMNSVVRQVSFDDFEERIHDERVLGVLTVEDFSRTWMDIIHKYYGTEGEVFDSFENAHSLWATIPHFHDAPFYVYGYAFAELVVAALATIYESGNSTSQPEFAEKLTQVLRAGGRASTATLAEIYSVDPAEPGFWDSALHGLAGTLLVEAERLSVAFMK